MTAHPNIVLIQTDQQRWDTLGVTGNPIVDTPHLDRLASQGALFETCVSGSPLSGPGRSCFLTGLPAGRTHVLNNYVRLPDPKLSLPARLTAAGYRTHGIGKLHFVTPEEGGRPCGLETVEIAEQTRFVRQARRIEDVAFDDYDRYLAERNMWGWDKPPEVGYNEARPLIHPLPSEHHPVRWCGDRAVEFIENAGGAEGPFFLWVAFPKPATPYTCPQHLVDKYDPDAMPAPWTSDGDGFARNPQYNAHIVNNDLHLLSDTARRMIRANYYANVTFIDEEVGRILESLARRGLDGETLVVFTSDHGDLMGDHYQFFKKFGYEGCLRVPLIVRRPGVVPAGTRVEGMANLTDLYATLLTHAGVDFPRDEHAPACSDDLLNWIAAPGAARETTFAENGNPPHYKLYVRSAGWKYIWFQHGGYEELYRLADDPHELTDLAGETDFADIKESLRQSAAEWIQRCGDPMVALDDAGELRVEAFEEENLRHFGRAHLTRPFSRMPWQARYPDVCVDENQRSWWWRACGGDFSQLIAYARSKAER